MCIVILICPEILPIPEILDTLEPLGQIQLEGWLGVLAAVADNSWFLVSSKKNCLLAFLLSVEGDWQHLTGVTGVGMVQGIFLAGSADADWERVTGINSWKAEGGGR